MAALALPDWRKWLRTARQKSDMAVLDRRHVYILPTRSGMLFGLMLIGMLLGSINYSLSLGFALTFWLAGLGLIAMLHTWRNLAHLVIVPGKILPVFAGETARFSYVVSDRRHLQRYAIGMQFGKGFPVLDDIPADGAAQIFLPMLTERRGWLHPGRVTVFTQFPLGLFHAWGYVDLNTACLVYPHPAPHGCTLPPFVAETQAQDGSTVSGGDEDFAGLRGYRPGDSMRRVDWKASARDQGIFTKEFEGSGQQVFWLAWEMTAGNDIEARLSLLTRWVLDAYEDGYAWGFSMPGVRMPPASDEAHFHACLRALALFGSR